MTPEQTPNWLAPLIGQLGISIIFILAWSSERKERQKIMVEKDTEIARIRAERDTRIAELTTQMMSMQTQHRTEILELLHSMSMPRFQAVPAAQGQIAA